MNAEVFVLKKCTCCRLDFPKTNEFFFAKVIKQQNKSGLAIYYSFRTICKKCYGKKGQAIKVKKRCKDLNCDVSDYRKNWKKQYSQTRTFDLEAKGKLSKGQYNVYLKNIKDGIINNLKEHRKKVFKNKHSKPWLRKFDYGNKIFLTLKERKTKANVIKIEKITDSYIINISGLKKGQLPQENIETKRLIIQLKRELKK